MGKIYGNTVVTFGFETFGRRIETHLVIFVAFNKHHVAPEKENGDSPKKRIIEFVTVVRDLEPERDEKIRGGGKSGDHASQTIAKQNGIDWADFVRFRDSNGRE